MATPLDNFEFIQVNLQHCRAATYLLSTKLHGNFIGLIQEPWIRNKKVNGLSGTEHTVQYAFSTERPRTCIVVQKT